MSPSKQFFSDEECFALLKLKYMAVPRSPPRLPKTWLGYLASYVERLDMGDVYHGLVPVSKDVK